MEGENPAGLRSGAAMLWADWTHRLWGCDFLASDVCALMCEAGPEAAASLLGNRAEAQEILGLCHWLVLCPGSSGGQSSVSRWLWAQEFCRQSIYLLGLRPLSTGAFRLLGGARSWL